MKNLLSYMIIKSIQKNWDEIVMQENGEKHSFKKLALFVIKLSTFLDRIKVDLSTPIALVGKLSFNWLVVYVTCLIKGIPLLILNPRDKSVNLKWQLIRNNVKILFHDFSSTTKSKPCQLHSPLLKVKISIIDFTHYMLYTDVESYAYYEDWAKAIDEFKNTDIDEQWKYSGEDFDRLQEDEFNEDNIAVLQYTPGASIPAHLIAFSFKKVYHIMSNINATILRKDVAYFTDHIYFHFMMILNKVINGEVIYKDREVWSETVRRQNIEKIGVESYLFKEMWDGYFDFLKERFYRVLQNRGRFFVNLKVRKKLRRILGPQIEEIIILNNELPFDTLLMLEDLKIKISSTYGTLESGQLLSFNDTNACKSIFTAGRPSYLYSFKINSENPLEIPGELLYADNQEELDLTYEPEYKWIGTGDIARINKDGELVIYGKKANAITNTLSPVFPERIERRIEMYPYIKKVYIVQWNGSICGIVEVDSNKLEAEKYTCLKLQNLLNRYTEKINKNIGEYNPIKYIAPVSMNLLPMALNMKPIRINFLKGNFHLLDPEVIIGK
jgi:long-subunit acyl-CoA synthetase (AMP-forming)